MTYNDQAYHGSNANINKVAQREVIIPLEIFYNHRNEFEIQEEYQEAFKKMIVDFNSLIKTTKRIE